MTKRTSQIEKKTFIGLVLNKLADKGYCKGQIKSIKEKEKDLDTQYKTAQRYARQLLGVKLNDPLYREKTEQFYKELAALVETDQVNEQEAITEDEAAAPVSEAESPATPPVDDAQPVETFWATPEAVPYLKLAGWLYAIDSSMINGTIAEAKQFISTIDGYCDRLRDLMAEKAKSELKEHLQQVWELETVLDRSEVENIWLEVGTERGELIVTPFSAETTTQVVELPITETPEVEQSNAVAL